jgi:hypothetical protein
MEHVSVFKIHKMITKNQIVLWMVDIKIMHNNIQYKHKMENKIIRKKE